MVKSCREVDEGVIAEMSPSIGLAAGELLCFTVAASRLAMGDPGLLNARAMGFELRASLRASIELL